jgi:hypothetical protein
LAGDAGAGVQANALKASRARPGQLPVDIQYVPNTPKHIGEMNH